MKLTNLFVACCLLILFSCKSYEKESVPGITESGFEVADSSYSLEASETTGQNQNVIRSAEMKIKVKDVKKSISSFENLAKSLGGFVEYSAIESSEIRSTTKAISEDSLLQVMEYDITGNITLRIPVSFFDTTVNVIQNTALFLNYRRTSANDISLQYLSNQLKASASEKSGNRIEEASGKGKKLEDIIYAEQSASGLANDAIDRKIANFELHQKVKFSSIHVNLSQANQVYKEIITNINISEYKPAFGERLLHALYKGWNGLLEFIIFIIRIWPFFVIGFIIFLLIKPGKFPFFKKKNTNQ